MFVIDWDCKPGYGDIISPICYAANQAEEQNTDVKLIFHFKNRGEYTRHHEESDCTDFLEDRIRFIEKYTQPKSGSLQIEFAYHSNLGRPHTNYPESPKKTSKWHNFRLADERIRWGSCQKRISDIVTIVSPTNNHDLNVPEGKLWKQTPVSNTIGWHEFENQICEQARYPIAVVDYKTHLEDLVSVMRRSYFVFSYHGSAAWVARWLGCPMAVMSMKQDWSEWNFPYSFCISHLHPDGRAWKEQIKEWHEKYRERHFE